VSRAEDPDEFVVDSTPEDRVQAPNEDDAERELVGADVDFAAASLSAPGRAAVGDAPAEPTPDEDDEDVSLDELMMFDSEANDEEEDEATEIRPGLSEAILAESLRTAPVPAAADAALAESGSDEAVVEEPTPLATEALQESELAAAGDAAEAQPGEQAAEEAIVAREDELPLEIEREAPESGGADGEAVEVAVLAESSPVHEEPTRPDASPDVLEAAPESEMEVLSSALLEAMTPEAALEAEEPSVPSVIDLDDSVESVGPPSAPLQTGERETVPETLAAKRRDAPLPSFDIPDLEALSAPAAGAAVAGEARGRSGARPVALPALSEIAEDDDDDDAVTHMGLPNVSEAANDYPGVTSGVASGFQVADPEVAALQSLDADISRGDPRRATTRVIPRVDPKTLPPKARRDVPAGPPLAERVAVLVRAARERVLQFLQPESPDPMLDVELSPRRRRLNWLVENVLPPLSLVLFGSGLGAAVILLVEPDRPAEASAQAQTIQALQEGGPAARGPLTLADRARAGDGEALYKITNLPQAERTSALTLALEAGYQAQKVREFKEFAKSTAAASGPLSAATVSRMVEYATSPETMLSAFQELTQWAGPSGPDVLYAVWEKAAGGSRAASLAQQLLYSADQRAKATPALLAALDLRSAANCDDYLKVLPAVSRNGDQRSSATLRALRHNDGCGADGQQDCYACLRDNSQLEDALKAIEAR
jgi:hypothetical protein